jgi:uncharacterized membrane protein
MVPWLEARYVIPFALNSELGFEWWQIFPVAVIGNILPVPFVLLFFKYAENLLRRYNFWIKILDWLFEHTRKRADVKIKRYEYIGLIFFVALPLPFTGAWTGSLIAYLFDLKFFKSLVTIFIGVLISTGIMTFITLTGLNIVYILIGIIIACVIMVITVIISNSKLRNNLKGFDR